MPGQDRPPASGPARRTRWTSTPAWRTRPASMTTGRGHGEFRRGPGGRRRGDCGLPGIVAVVRANRAFLARAVRYMAAAGVRQFLDIGTGIPTADNTHEAAQRAAADARIVYVDHDPIVARHATSLLPVTSEGATSFIAGDARDPDAILAQAQRRLDFSQPVAIMLLGILQLIWTPTIPGASIAVQGGRRSGGRPAPRPGPSRPSGSAQTWPGGSAGGCPPGWCCAGAPRYSACSTGSSWSRRTRAAGPVASGTGRHRPRPAVHGLRRGRPQARHPAG